MINSMFPEIPKGLVFIVNSFPSYAISMRHGSCQHCFEKWIGARSAPTIPQTNANQGTLLGKIFSIGKIELTHKHLQNFLSPKKGIWIKLYFCQWKCANPAKYLTGICAFCPNPWLVSIGSRNGLPPIWRQAISWITDDKNLCYLEGIVDAYELKCASGCTNGSSEGNGLIFNLRICIQDMGLKTWSAEIIGKLWIFHWVMSTLQNVNNTIYTAVFESMAAIENRVNIIPADALATNVARASAGMILTQDHGIYWLHYKV